MTGIIEFLIIAALIYFGVGKLIRFILSLLVKSVVNKAQQGQQQYSQQYNSNNQSRNNNEGHIRVDKAPKVKSSIPDSEGEYIDYEEIK